MAKALNIISVVLMLALFSANMSAQKSKHTFEIKDGSFLYDKKPLQIISGEMHYPRIPEPYWRNRLKMAKAMGLNTVAVYAFWNYHNIAPGKWDFESENHNLAKFIRTAQEEGLFVILRPGPYVCAEWEFGGYPWWLQNNKNLTVRAKGAFLDSCKIYIRHLAEQVKGLQVTQGGPVIMVQVENEYGSYVSQRPDISKEDHKEYYNAIKNTLSEAGFNVPFFTSDGSWLFDGGAIPGILPTANGEGNIENLKNAVNKFNNGKGPYMVAEYYPGWLDHWGESFVKISPEEVSKQVETYLTNNISFNFYMVHGGTNFGFTSGANYNDSHDIQPDITSYDYDAPINEAGWATPKFKAVREVIKKHVSYNIPEIPQQTETISIPEIKLDQNFNVLNIKKTVKPVKSDMPLTFEELGQGAGYVLYSKRFTQPIHGKINISGLRDFATLYINGKYAGSLNRATNTYTLDITIPFNSVLDILVENMGRINYGSKITENTKGIIEPVTLNNYQLTGNWEMYKLPMNTVPDIIFQNNPLPAGVPAFYKGVFNLDKTGDTFLDMALWEKGIVFINGHNLGRYWNVGPQQTLYVPGCWLNKGSNEVFIFEQLNTFSHNTLKTVNNAVLDSLQVAF